MNLRRFCLTGVACFTLLLSACPNVHENEPHDQQETRQERVVALNVECGVPAVVTEVFSDKDSGKEVIKVVCKTAYATATEHWFLRDNNQNVGDEISLSATIAALREDRIGFKLNNGNIEYGIESDIRW